MMDEKQIQTADFLSELRRPRMTAPNKTADERACGHGRPLYQDCFICEESSPPEQATVPVRHEVITGLEEAYRSAVQLVINQFQGDAQAMAIEIVRLRGELMASEA